MQYTFSSGLIQIGLIGYFRYFFLIMDREGFFLSCKLFPKFKNWISFVWCGNLYCCATLTSLTSSLLTQSGAQYSFLSVSEWSDPIATTTIYKLNLHSHDGQDLKFNSNLCTAGRLKMVFVEHRQAIINCVLVYVAGIRKLTLM